MGRFIDQRRVVILCVLATTACHKGLSPASLSFSPSYVGLKNILPLNFTLGGKPLQQATMTLQESDGGSSHFSLAPVGPFGAPPAFLAFSPVEVKDEQTTLKVVVGSQTFIVPVASHVGGPETPCPAGQNECQVATFNLQTMQCSIEPSPLPPTTSACMSTFLDQLFAGPRWTYHTTTPIAWQGTMDSAGAVYFLECASYASSCDLVSLNLDGSLQWRQVGAVEVVAGRFEPSTPPRIMIVGSTLIIASATLSPEVQAFEVKSGNKAWSLAVDQFLLATGVSDTVAAIASGGAPGLQYVDASSGEVLASPTLSLGGSISSLIGDGTGVLYGSISPGGMLFAADQQTGLHWMKAAPDPSATVVAVNGTMLFLNPPGLVSISDSSTVSAGSGKLQVNGVATSPGGSWFAGLTDVANQTCDGERAAGFNATSGETRFDCHFGFPSQAISGPYADGIGGFAFLINGFRPAQLGQTAQAVIVGLDDQGNENSQAILSSATPDPNDNAIGIVVPAGAGPAAVFGQRWIVPSVSPLGGTEIDAFDLPDLTAGQHGWVGPGGNNARNGLPL